jgi:uncharacterized spore protein YtfJ
MTIEELFARAKNSVEARMVFAEPIEKDGITVVPAARVAVGGGGGNGSDKQGRQGEGGGLGLTARPVGAYVIANGTLRWEPAVDVNRLMTVAGGVLAAGLWLATRAAKHRTRG